MDVIVNFTPTGMIPTKQMTPHIPVSNNEVVENVHEAFDLGITMVHLHARDKKTGLPSQKGEIYRDIIEKIRKFSKELIICVSLSGRTVTEFRERAEPLQLDGNLKPDMGSLTLSSVNFNRIASMNSPDMIKALATEMMKRGILAELEAFDSGMINYAKYLESKGLLEPPHYFNFLLGNIACAQANILHLGVMINDLPANSYWSVGGIGDSQLMMDSVSIAYGGGVRVGLEDNIWFDKKRKKLATNADLLRRIHTLIEANGRKFMSPGKLREMLNLEDGNGKYGRKKAEIDTFTTT